MKEMSVQRSFRMLVGFAMLVCAAMLSIALPKIAHADQNVAKIGNVEYASIQAAVDAAENGDTIVIIADHEIDCSTAAGIHDGGYASLVNVYDKSVTIDLNGKDISVDISDAEKAAFAEFESFMLLGVFTVDTNGALTLKDSSGGESLVNLKSNGAKVYSLITNFNSTAYLTIEGGSYVADAVSDSLIYSGTGQGNAVIKGGSFTLGNIGQGPNGNGSPWIFNSYRNNENHIKVLGGTFNADVLHQHWNYEVQVGDENVKNKALRDNKDGTWTMIDDAPLYAVEKRMERNRTIGYASLADALAAKGITINLQEIYLQDDCIATDTLFVNDSFVLHLKDPYDVDAEKNSIIWKAGSDIPVYTVAAGETLTVEASEDLVPVRPGYIFGGWYTDAALSSPYSPEKENVVDGGDQGVSLYAKWIADEYKITWTNGENVFSTTPEQVFDEKLTLPATTPSKASEATCYTYEFAGWFTEPEGGDQVTADTVFNTPEDTTYFAHFTRKGSSATSAVGHIFDEKWSYDSEKHWHKTTCGHDYIADEAAHSFGDDLLCDTCGYKDVSLPSTGDGDKEALAKTGDPAPAAALFAIMACATIALVGARRLKA